LGIIQAGWSPYSRKNLNEFFTTYAPQISNGTHPIEISINGANASAPAGKSSSEANLDLMVAYGLLGETNIKQFQAGLTDAYPGNYLDNDALVIPLLDAVDPDFCSDKEKGWGFQCGGVQLSKVVSMSFGEPELFRISAKKQRRVCHEFMKLALQGHTIVFSTGDFGVGGNSNYNTRNPLKANGQIPYQFLVFLRHKLTLWSRMYPERPR
jgi:tripeptidyl-peptidase I